MDVGWGVLLDESEVYGAALASAYQKQNVPCTHRRSLGHAIIHLCGLYRE